MTPFLDDPDAGRALDAHQLVALLGEAHPAALALTDATPGPAGPVLLWCNRAFERLTGYTRRELIGGTPRLLQGPRTERQQVRRLGLALLAGKPARVVVTNYRRGGEPYLCDIAILPLGQDPASGRPTHFLAFEREVRRRRGRPAADGSGRFDPVDPGPFLPGEPD
ncbi:MAG: PAS domain-containing protein [Acetobacteraceae bacterium]|nr:PAS domain-containing protein [Acetobacteraceae bacterium]